MMAAVSTHWNHVTNSGALMSFSLVSAVLGISSLLANTSVMDTRKYRPTTPAMRRCSVTAIAAQEGERGGEEVGAAGQPSNPNHSAEATTAERETRKSRTRQWLGRVAMEEGRCTCGRHQ